MASFFGAQAHLPGITQPSAVPDCLCTHRKRGERIRRLNSSSTIVRRREGRHRLTSGALTENAWDRIRPKLGDHPLAYDRKRYARVTVTGASAERAEYVVRSDNLGLSQRMRWPRGESVTADSVRGKPNA